MPVYPRNLGGDASSSGGGGNASVGALLRQDGHTDQGLFISDKTGQADVSWHLRGVRREAAEPSVAASARFTGTGTNNYLTTSFADSGDTTHKRFTPLQGADYQDRIDDPETINTTYSFNYVEYPNPEPAEPDVKSFYDYNDLRVTSTADGTAGDNDLLAVFLGTEPRTSLNAIADIELVRGVTPGISPQIRVRAPDLNTPATGNRTGMVLTFHEGGTGGNGFVIQYRSAVDTGLTGTEISATYTSATELQVLVVRPSSASYTLDWNDVVPVINAARRSGEQLIIASASGSIGTSTYTPTGTRASPNFITTNTTLAGGQSAGGTATRTGGVTVVHSDTRVRTVGAQAEVTIDSKVVIKFAEGTGGNGRTVHFNSSEGSTAGTLDQNPFLSNGNLLIRVRTGDSPTYPVTVTPTVGDIIDRINNWTGGFDDGQNWTAELAGGASRSDTISLTFASNAATVSLPGNTLAGGSAEVNENPLAAVWDDMSHTLTITALATDTANEVITAITALDEFQAGAGQTPGDVYLNNALGGDTIVVAANVGDTLTDRFTGGRNARARSTLVVTSFPNFGDGFQMSISGLIQSDTVQDIIDAYTLTNFTLSSVSGDATTTFTGAAALPETSLAGGVDAVAAVDRNLPWIYVEAIDDSNVWYDIWYHGPGSDANQRSTLAELRDAWTNISTVNGLAPNPPVTTITGSGSTRIASVPTTPSGGSNYIPASPIEALVRPSAAEPQIEVRYDETTDTLMEIAFALDAQGVVNVIDTYGTDLTASPEATPFVRSMFAGGGTGASTPTNITIAEGSGSVEVRSSSGMNDSIAPASQSRAGVMLPADRDQLNALPDEWDATETYSEGDQVALSEKIYVSQTNSNTNNNPGTDDGTNWVVLGTGGGTDIEANPSGAVDGGHLEKVDIGGVIYDITSGGGDTFRFESIGTYRRTATFSGDTNEWIDTGIDLPATVQTGETWAVRFLGARSNQHDYFMFPAADLTGATNSVVGGAMDPDALTVDHERGVVFSYEFYADEHTVALGRTSGGDILIAVDVATAQFDPLELYKVTGGGTNVQPNPGGSATGALTTVSIDGVTYSIAATIDSLSGLTVPRWTRGEDYDQDTLLIGPDDELYRLLADVSGSTTVPAGNKGTFERVDGYDGDYADNTAYKRGRIVTHSNNPYFVNAAVADTNTDDPTANSAFIQLNAAGGGGGLATVATDATISGDGTTGNPLMVANEFTADDESHLDALPPEYAATTTYSIGDQVSLSGKIYASQINTNLNNDPSSDDGSNWAVLGTGTGTGGGTTVVANPGGDADGGDLTTVTIDGTVYDIPAGGTSADGIFKFENIGSQSVNITTANSWTDTGIDIPATIADGETWAIRIESDLSFDPTWKMIPATSITGLTNAVIGETWDADATSTSAGAQRDRGLQIDFPWGGGTGRYTMAFGRDSNGNILIAGEATAFDPMPLVIAKVVGASGSGGSSSGLATVATDATITGDGTSGDPLTVANPFTDDDETKLDAVPAPWDSSTTYSDEDQVNLSGKLYISQVDSNTNNNPATDDGTNWIPAGQSTSTGGDGLATVLTDTTLTGDGTSTNRLSVTNPFTDADETTLDNTTADVVLAYSATAQHTVADSVVYGDTVVITYDTNTYDARVLTASRNDHIVTLVLAPGVPWTDILGEANATVSKAGDQFLSWTTASLQTTRGAVSSTGQFWYVDGAAASGDETWREIKRVDDFDNTHLGLSGRDDDSLTITSTTGNNVELPSATNALAGLESAADKELLEALPPKWVSAQVYGAGAHRMFGETLYECVVDRAITDTDDPATDTTGWKPVTAVGEANLALGTRNDDDLQITSSSGDNVTLPQASASGGAGLISGSDQEKLDAQIPEWTDDTYSGAGIPRLFNGRLYETTQEITTATGNNPFADTTNWRQVSVPDLSSFLTSTSLANYRTQTQITTEIGTAVADLVVDKGDYDETEAYSEHDQVQNEGATYIAIASVAANTATTTEPGVGSSWDSSWKRVGFAEGPDDAFTHIARDGSDNIIFSRRGGDNPATFNLGSGALELNELGSENITLAQQNQWAAPSTAIDISEIGADDEFAIRWNNGNLSDHRTYFLHGSSIVNNAVAGQAATGTIALHVYAGSILGWETLRLGRTSDDELVVAASDSTIGPNPLTIYKFGGSVTHNRTRVECITFEQVTPAGQTDPEAVPIAANPITVVSGDGDPEIISNVSGSDFTVAAGVYLVDYEANINGSGSSFINFIIRDSADDTNELSYSSAPRLIGAAKNISVQAVLFLEEDKTVNIQVFRDQADTQITKDWNVYFTRWGGGKEIRTVHQFTPTDLGTTTFDLDGSADDDIVITGTDGNALVCPDNGYIISIMTIPGVGAEGALTWHLATDLRDANVNTALPLSLYTNSDNELLLSVGAQTGGTATMDNKVIIQHLGTTTDTSTGASDVVLPSILRFDVTGVRHPAAGNIGETFYNYTVEISQSSHVGSARIIGFPGAVRNPSAGIITELQSDTALTTSPNGYSHATGRVEIPTNTMIAEDGIYTIRLEVRSESQSAGDDATIYHDYQIIGGAPAAMSHIHFGSMPFYMADGSTPTTDADLASFAGDISTSASAAGSWTISGLALADGERRLYWAVPATADQPTNWINSGDNVNDIIDSPASDSDTQTIGGVAYFVYVTNQPFDDISNGLTYVTNTD